MENETIETRTLRIRLGDDGIVRSNPIPGAEMTLTDAREGNEAIRRISKGRKRPLLCDYTGIKSQTRECRAYYAGKETAQATSACAILANSTISRVIGSFYLGLNKPVTPTKIFTSKQEALEWLKGFIE